MPCFYTPHLDDKKKFLKIENEEFHHIINVFRKNKGDDIILSNGKGILANAIITSIEKKSLNVQIDNINKFSHRKPDIAVAFSLLKQKNDFLIVEKLTELGIREFFPIITDRTIKKTSPNLKEKYIKTTISAIKQCDNAYLPIVNEPLHFIKLFQTIKKMNYTPFVAAEFETEKTFFDLYDKQEKICLIFGPEGGFSQKEINFIKDEKINTFTIGNHILRAETAAIAASAIVINSIFEKDRKYY